MEIAGIDEAFLSRPSWCEQLEWIMQIESVEKLDCGIAAMEQRRAISRNGDKKPLEFVLQFTQMQRRRVVEL